MADFQNGLISPIFSVFCSVFLHIAMICTMDFGMFFGILIFDPKSGFCMGDSLCMMTDFQKGLISGIFRVFCSGFLHRTILNDLFNGFSHVFRYFNF